LNGKDESADSGLVHPVITVQKFPNLLNLRKTTRSGGFSFTEQEITREKGS